MNKTKPYPTFYIDNLSKEFSKNLDVFLSDLVDSLAGDDITVTQKESIATYIGLVSKEIEKAVKEETKEAAEEAEKGCRAHHGNRPDYNDLD